MRNGHSIQEVGGSIPLISTMGTLSNYFLLTFLEKWVFFVFQFVKFPISAHPRRQIQSENLPLGVDNFVKPCVEGAFLHCPHKLGQYKSVGAFLFYA